MVDSSKLMSKANLRPNIGKSDAIFIEKRLTKVFLLCIIDE